MYLDTLIINDEKHTKVTKVLFSETNILLKQGDDTITLTIEQMEYLFTTYKQVYEQLQII